MSELKNIRQEKFCQLVVAGKPAMTAYVAAGYCERGAGQNSARLMQNERVSQRIAELRKKDAQKMEYGIEQWREDTFRLMRLCEENEQYSVAAKLNEQIAKHIGAYEADNRQKATQVNVGIAVNLENKDAADAYKDIIGAK